MSPKMHFKKVLQQKVICIDIDDKRAFCIAQPTPESTKLPEVFIMADKRKSTIGQWRFDKGVHYVNRMVSGAVIYDYALEITVSLLGNGLKTTLQKTSIIIISDNDADKRSGDPNFPQSFVF
jgi:hypothetical protein